jgi:hypothetical protein
VHRGFLNEQRADTPEGVEAADKGFARSDSLLTTTDIRAPKAVAIQQAQDKGGKAEGCVAWWIEGAQLQVRAHLHLPAATLLMPLFAVSHLGHFASHLVEQPFRTCLPRPSFLQGRDIRLGG